VYVSVNAVVGSVIGETGLAVMLRGLTQEFATVFQTNGDVQALQNGGLFAPLPQEGVVHVPPINVYVFVVPLQENVALPVFPFVLVTFTDDPFAVTPVCPEHVVPDGDQETF
jgi:hypothetical protein